MTDIQIEASISSIDLSFASPQGNSEKSSAVIMTGTEQGDVMEIVLKFGKERLKKG